MRTVILLSVLSALTGLGAARSLKAPLSKRDDNVPCAPQPEGYGPVTSDPDTAEAFLANPVYSSIAAGAQTPQGYVLVFSGLNSATIQGDYLGLYTLTTYDTIRCQQLCDQAAGCTAFNLYIERDPSLDPADACPDPASTTNYKCTLWNLSISNETAINNGETRNQFQVVIAGSNGYVKNDPPSPADDFTGPVPLGGAIQAPLFEGNDTYMGMRVYSGVYDPGQCAAACIAQTEYNLQHPPSDGTDPLTCSFFNSYVLSENNIPQGTYCSFYSIAWDASYATNFGQYRGDDYYSVSSSYAYSLV